MFSIYYCIRDDHDLRLVLLAGLICIATSFAAVNMLRQARDDGGREARRWLAAAGATSGFGIWATHFVAMMGYDPGVIAGYDLTLTMASLAIGIGGTTAGFWLALGSPHKRMRWAGGAIVGLGIAAMHYLGMQAVELAGEFRWSAGHVLSSIVFAIVPIGPALMLALDRHDRGSAIGAALLIVLAILLLHFTGMAGITIIPGRLEEHSLILLSSFSMGLAVAGTALSVLAIGLNAALTNGRARKAIADNEREFHALIQGISDCAIYRVDPAGRVASWNAGAERLKGYTSDEAIGLDLAAFHSSEEVEAGLPAATLAAARRDGRYSAEGWRYRKDGSRFWAHVTVEPFHDERGTFQGFAKVTRDMTRFKEDQDRLAEMAGNFDAALSNMHQGLCLFDADGRMVIGNDRVRELFGVAEDECPVGTPFAEVFRLGLEKRAGSAVPQEVLQEVLDRHHACIAQPNGGALVVPFTEDCTLTIAHRPMKKGGWVTTFDDITDRRRAEQRIEHMALHDGLTGLPNRIHFSDRLDAELKLAARNGHKLAVIGIDLDRFKEINDVHGHATGDAVLRAISARLTAALEPHEHVARFGGDEFAACKTYTDDHDLHDFVARLFEALNSKIELDGLSITPGASLGIAAFPSDGSTREQMVNNADLAMYRAKETIGRQVCYYEPGMDQIARARRMLANDLREAIPRSELSLAYQVQKSVTTEAITGYEALLRWQHPRDGWISPSEFIPIAEESGEILKIGEWVLRTACRDAAKWPQPWRVAVNLSGIQLMHVDLLETVTAALLESGLAPSRLELEITETAFVSDKVRALHVLRQIKALGVSIAIDDFGTGYSSLDTLNSFPFDKIKIDKSFLLESQDSHQARAIIRAVLALGRSLEVPVLAEGLESDEQLRLLRSEGCDQAQGYLWGRPMPIPSSLIGNDNAVVNAA